MKHCTAVQEGCGYKDTLRAHRYFAPLAKYFTVCITYQPAYVFYHNLLMSYYHLLSSPKLQNCDFKLIVFPNVPLH